MRALPTEGTTVTNAQEYHLQRQADTLWLKVRPAADSGNTVRAYPILVISDATTRLCAARLLPDETPESFQKALERAWIRSCGPMRILQVDEYRSWANDHFKEWTGQHSIQLMISPGQAHERLVIIERRHQVIRRSLDFSSGIRGLHP